MYLAPPIVQSEELNYNPSELYMQIFSEHASKLCVIAAASVMVKTGKPMSDCDISAYEKMRIPKLQTN